MSSNNSSFHSSNSPLTVYDDNAMAICPLRGVDIQGCTHHKW